MLWQLSEELNLIETNFEEYFDWIIIHENVFLHQIIQILIYLQQLVVIWPIQPRTRAIVAGNDSRRSIAPIKHANLSKVTALIKRSHLLFFEPILKLISDYHITFTFGDEVDLISFRGQLIILVAEM
jgi:hypothetical protein